jgi:hypothetical protein
MFDSLTSPEDLKKIDKTTIKCRSTISPLSEEETEKALPVLSRTEGLELYRSIDRRYADPEIPGQKYCLVSFIPSKGAKPDSDNIYGMMKVRGVYATEEEANERAEFIIRNTDSLHEIFHAFVGRPFPVTTKTGFENEIQTIDIRQKTVDLISQDILSKKCQEKKEMEELQDKEKILLEESKRAQEGVPEDPFETYITNQVKRAQLLWTYRETQKKMEQMKESFKSAQILIQELDKEHPSFHNDYREKYMKARRDAGIPDSDESFIQYLGLDLPPEDM